jgi:hypothetical protein
MDNAAGWYVRWEDGRTELVFGFDKGDDGAYAPLVVSEDSKSIVPALSRGEFTLENPGRYTRHS